MRLSNILQLGIKELRGLARDPMLLVLIALAAHDLVAKANGNLYAITAREEGRVPLRLDFATSSRGTFFLLGKTIYPQAQFPYQLKQDGGHWYALVPKSLADQLRQPGDSGNHARL